MGENVEPVGIYSEDQVLPCNVMSRTSVSSRSGMIHFSQVLVNPDGRVIACQQINLTLEQMKNIWQLSLGKILGRRTADDITFLHTQEQIVTELQERIEIVRCLSTMTVEELVEVLANTFQLPNEGCTDAEVEEHVQRKISSALTIRILAVLFLSYLDEKEHPDG